MEDERAYPRILQRLRALRLTTGRTLKEVELQSNGRWKAVVIGSYERGTRHLSLKRAVELCGFYGSDIAALGSAARLPSKYTFMLDLKALLAARQLPDDFTKRLSRFTNAILAQRNDLNGQVLSLRNSDLETIGLLSGMNSDEVSRALLQRKLLIRELDPS